MHKQNSTVVPKSVDIEEVWRDSRVAAAFVEDKIEREGAHVLIQTVASQVDDIMGKGFFVTHCTPPDKFGVTVWNGEFSGYKEWVEDEQQMFWFDKDGNRLDAVIPRKYLSLEKFKDRVCILNFTMDRCPQNSSMGNYLVFEKRQTVVPWAGCLHDLWHIVKNSGTNTVVLRAPGQDAQHDPERGGASRRRGDACRSGDCGADACRSAYQRFDSGRRSASQRFGSGRGACRGGG